MTDQEVPSSSSTQMITPEHQDGQDEGVRLAELLENGRDIRENYLPMFEPLPNQQPEEPPLFQLRMIPPLPNSKFVDKMDMKLVNKMGNEDKKKLMNLRFHSMKGYEAEVNVFRALERLKLDKEKVTVLHSLEYSKSDYELFTGEKKDGECDFVVMGENYFLIIEVKKNKAHENKAKDQTERTEKLIAGIMAKIAGCTKTPQILKFPAFPFDSNKKNKGERKRREQIDTTREMKITGDNLKNDESFSDWWKTQVKTQVMLSESDEQYSLRDYKETRDVLTALWATENNVCQKERCSLSWNVLDVDKKLKKGHITFVQRPKDGIDPETLRNPDVVEAPDVISECVGVDNLTTEQNKVCQSEQKLLFISGPAGSGKTVLLAGKLIQLVQENPDKKVVVFKFAGGKNNSTVYQDACKNANVEFDVLPLTQYIDYSGPLQQLITNSEKSVVIAVVVQVSSLPDRRVRKALTLLSNCNVIIDDLQCLCGWKAHQSWAVDNLTVVMDTLVTLSVNNTVRVACDVVQYPRGYSYNTHVDELCSFIARKLSDDQIVFLTKNLRNTYDISNILNVIRNYNKKSSVLRYTDIEALIPEQVTGHFIRGTITQFHVFNNDNDMINFVNKLINKLLMNKEFDNSNVAVVVDDFNYSVLPLIDSDRITKCLCENSSSSEWPVVIVLHQVSGDLNTQMIHDNTISQLYLALSRARVMCYVVLFPSPRTPGRRGLGRSDLGFFDEVLKELEPFAHVIRH